MMKKSLLSLLVAAATIGSANAAVVYDNQDTSLAIGGRLQANLNSVFANNDPDKTDKVAVEGYARANVDAKSKIADGYKAIAYGEWDVSSESSENGKFDTRFAYVGLESDSFGTLTAGQNYTAMYNVIGATDMFIDGGSTGNTFWDLGGRQEGQLVYSYAFNGFSFGASWQTAGLDTVNGGYAVTAGYTFDLTKDLPVAFNLGTDGYDLKHTADDVKSFATSLSLGTLGDGTYVAGLYQLTSIDNASDKNGYELVGGYGFDNGLAFLLGYNVLRQGSRTLVSNVSAELSYNVNPSMIVYLEAVVGASDVDSDKLDDNGNVIGTNSERSHDSISLRAQYNF